MISKNQGFFSRFYRLSPKPAKTRPEREGTAGPQPIPSSPPPPAAPYFKRPWTWKFKENAKESEKSTIDTGEQGTDLAFLNKNRGRTAAPGLPR
jgi:hypothetical protein